MQSKKNTNTKYMTLYMSLGACFGFSAGLIFGRIVFPDNMILGMSFGLPIGLCVGMVIGQEKDKRLSENIMIIKKLETINNSLDMVIYANDKNEIEKQYIVNYKKVKGEKFSEGDRVAEEIDGSLVSLEIK